MGPSPGWPRGEGSPPCSEDPRLRRVTAHPRTAQQAGVLGRCSQGWFLPSQEGQPRVVSRSFPTHTDFSKMITFNSKPKQLFLRGSLVYRGKKPLSKSSLTLSQCSVGARAGLSFQGPVLLHPWLLAAQHHLPGGTAWYGL